MSNMTVSSEEMKTHLDTAERPSEEREKMAIYKVRGERAHKRPLLPEP